MNSLEKEGKEEKGVVRTKKSKRKNVSNQTVLKNGTG